MAASCPRTPSQGDARHGFTLIEMSIVVIIVGLLIGGILAGGSLIDASENRRIAEDVDNYRTAMGQFRDKYGSLPGDMYDAETIWGQTAAGAACKTTPSTVKATCNGDGDGQIELGTVVGAGASQTVEHLRAWQQLNNAGFVAAALTGVPGAGGDDHAVPGTNVASGVLDGTGYTLYYRGAGDAAGAGNFFGVDTMEAYGHILQFGQATAASITDAPALLPQEAWEIDTKFDDGKPSSGSIRTYQASAQPNCATADDGTAIYNVAYEDGRSCNLMFLTGY